MGKRDFLDDLDDELSQNTSSRFKAQQASLFDAVQPDIDPIVEVWAQPVALPPYPRENEVWSHPIGEEPRYATYNPNSRMNRVDPDLIGEIKFQEPNTNAYDGSTLNRVVFDTEVPAPKPRPIMGADILAIRELTGKKRDNAMKLLYKQAEDMLHAAPKEWFYIPSNVPSSKNSKDIITVKRMTKQGLKEFSVPIPSKPVKEYMKETKGYWIAGKQAFREEVKKHQWPIQLEFIFIRDSIRRFDFINAAQILMDLMSTGEIKDNKYSWLPDDESCYVVPVFRPCVYYHNKLAGVLIRVMH